MSTRISQLPGGMRIVTENMPHLESVSLGVWAGSGARHETPDQHGLAHLMEHMAFKGTKTRSAYDIAEAIEAVGGDINAATSLESTAFYARMLKGDVDLALNILADILQNPKFAQDELEREKAVIAQEIGASHDTPDDLVFELFQEAAYPGQALGRSILGTHESLQGFDANRLEAFRKHHYTQPSLILCAAGAIDHDELVARAEEVFGTFAQTPSPIAEPAHFHGSDKRKSLPLEQVHLVLGFEGVAYNSENIYVAQILATILGGGMSSRLFQEVRERRGLCYSIFAFSWSFADSGQFGIYAGASEESVSELISVLGDELHKIGDGVLESELARARAQAKAGLLMSLESSSARAEQMARQLMVFGKIFTTQELMAKIEAINVQSVSSLAQQLFASAKPAIGAVGPLKNLASYDEITTQFQ